MRRFYQHEDGSHAETFYSLARDPETGAAFVHHEWFDKVDVGQRRVMRAPLLQVGVAKNLDQLRRF